MKTFYWLVKREYWEHRGGFLRAPLVACGLFLLINLAGLLSTGQYAPSIRINGNVMQLQQLLDKQPHSMIGAVLDSMMYSSSVIISAVLGFVVFFYCLGALYDDRRDRSVLFWKSLPLSDTSTVLSKLFAASVLAPAIGVACGVLSGLLLLAMYALALSFHGAPIGALLQLAHPFRVGANLLACIPLYALWALPAIGWLLFCSALARSKPFLWAVAPLIALGFMISWFQWLDGRWLDSHWYWHQVCGRLLLSTFPGGWLEHTDMSAANVRFEHLVGQMNIEHSYRILGTPDIWIGAGAGVVLLAAATWLRRWRDDS